MRGSRHRILRYPSRRRKIGSRNRLRAGPPPLSRSPPPDANSPRAKVRLARAHLFRARQAQGQIHCRLPNADNRPRNPKHARRPLGQLRRPRRRRREIHPDPLVHPITNQFPTISRHKPDRLSLLNNFHFPQRMSRPQRRMPAQRHLPSRRKPSQFKSPIIKEARKRRLRRLNSPAIACIVR